MRMSYFQHLVEAKQYRHIVDTLSRLPFCLFMSSRKSSRSCMHMGYLFSRNTEEGGAVCTSCGLLVPINHVNYASLDSLR